MKVNRQGQPAGRLESAWKRSGEKMPDMRVGPAADDPRERFVPGRAGQAPALQNLQKSQMRGFVSGQPLARTLSQHSIEVASGMLGGPVGYVLHLSAKRGAMVADLRPAGATRAGVRLEPTKAEYSSESAFKLDNGKTLRVYTVPCEPDKDKTVQISVAHPDGLRVSAEWKADGSPDRVYAYHNATHAELRGGGDKLWLFGSTPKYEFLRANATGTDRLPPAEFYPSRHGDVALQMPRWPERATRQNVIQLLRDNDRLLSEVERRHPDLAPT